MPDRVRVKPEVKLLTAQFHLHLEIVAELDLLRVVDFVKIEEKCAVILLSSFSFSHSPFEYVISFGDRLLVRELVCHLNLVVVKAFKTIDVKIEALDIISAVERADSQREWDQF